MTFLWHGDEFDALDLFSGPGGWDLACAVLGIRCLGVEFEKTACETREAAGLHTIHADVMTLDPMQFVGVRLFIASPPCQTFSMSGGGAGRKALGQVMTAAFKLRPGEDIHLDHIEGLDEKTRLVLEPLRWIGLLRPEFVALEQVPPVLPLWQLYVQILRRWGYRAQTRKLQAEEYGVPQTRERAVLVASRVGAANLPASTHRRFRKGTPQWAGDQDLLPWISMAEALGWGADAHPAITVLGGSDGREQDLGVFGRQALALEMVEGRWVQRSNYGVSGTATKGERDVTEPSSTITGKADRMFWRNGNQDNSAERDLTEPAPTVAFGHKANDVRWVVGAGATGEGRPRSSEDPAPTITGKGTAAWLEDATVSTGVNSATVGPSQRTGDWRGESEQYERPVTDPAPTVTTAAGSAWRVGPAGHRTPTAQRTDNSTAFGNTEREVGEPSMTIRAGHGGPQHQWVHDRPATSVQADPRIAEPGHRDRENGARQFGEESVRVHWLEAAILQGFPPTYPWRGNKTKKHE